MAFDKVTSLTSFVVGRQKKSRVCVICDSKKRRGKKICSNPDCNCSVCYACLQQNFDNAIRTGYLINSGLLCCFLCREPLNIPKIAKVDTNSSYSKQRLEAISQAIAKSNEKLYVYCSSCYYINEYCDKECGQSVREGNLMCSKCNLSRAEIIKESKKCPGCGRSIMKNGGCSHMTCPCGTHFCWICLERVSGYAHFQNTGH